MSRNSTGIGVERGIADACVGGETAARSLKGRGKEKGGRDRENGAA
jgi:hypothetical protein